MNAPIHNQQGTTLVISLILLLLATLIGISVIKTSELEEKMSYNLQDKNVAFTAAESALLAGENWILALTTEPLANTACQQFPCVQKLYTSVDVAAQDANWWQSNSASYGNRLGVVKSPPHYIIEYVRFVADSPAVGQGVPTGSHYYRITARGTGATDNSQAVVQTTIARRF